MGVVRDAVLVAAGLGTRMFPISAFVPKETLPLVDVPLLTHLILEAKAAGIERLHIVVSPSKSFDHMLENKSDALTLRPQLDAVLFAAAEGMEVFTHLQMEPKGVGDAIGAALDAVEGPFLVMLGDNLLMDVHASTAAYAPSLASQRLIAAHGDREGATVGLMEVSEDAVQRYGIVAMDGDNIVAMVEKPTVSEAPSRLALCGRYVFPHNTQEALAGCSFEEHGELQSIAVQKQWMEEGHLYGTVLENTQWYDSGSPETWLQAQVDHALRRPDLGPAFARWLKQRLDGQR